ncbi:uncharacterized protein LOC143201056 [Rhynchophorus ferrugineus]|uniref:uncharacterized protein LOC143201056 n=1 Tax=Rhynchophorus ferrugineus TaxID=354439 RepID=UPI003FCE4B99
MNGSSQKVSSPTSAVKILMRRANKNKRPYWRYFWLSPSTHYESHVFIEWMVIIFGFLAPMVCRRVLYGSKDPPFSTVQKATSILSDYASIVILLGIIEAPATNAVGDNSEEATRKLQQASDNINNWTQAWKIKTNESKSVHVQFIYNQTIQVPITLNHTIIPYSNNDKYLRMKLHAKLR